jgi:flagellar hook-length control protein FliK
VIHNDIQNQLALLIKTQAPPLIDVASSAVESPEWAPGQQLPAHVIASLGNNRFQVMVEDQALDMTLPSNTQAGDKLELVFVSGNPRPTFTLLSDLTKALPNQSSSVVLSDTSKLMGLLQQAGNAANPKLAEAPALASSTPIVPGEPPPLQQFADALRNAISQSGLFYESHQAEWVVGERPLSSLLLEPQAQLSPMLNQQKGGAASTTQTPADNTSRAAQTNSATQSQPATAQVKLDMAQMVITSRDAASVVGAANNQVNNPVHPSTAPLVQNQLDMLGSHQIIWQGQAWPGQQMEWAIEEDNRRAADAEQITTWRTRLHLNFPLLGGVTAHLALVGKGLNIDFSVEHGSSAQLLRGQAPSLTQAMETSGLQVTSLTVRQDGE